MGAVAGGKWPSHPNLHFESYEDGRASEENKCGPSSFLQAATRMGAGAAVRWTAFGTDRSEA